MKSSLFATTLAGIFALCEAVPTPSTYAIHEKRSSIPRLWTRGNRVESDAILPIRIGLTQSNLNDGEALLMDV